MVERFAPSPTGFLHLGHAFSAFSAFNAAQSGGGRFLLRIEDIDQPRCKPAFVGAIFEDLNWLGMEWDVPVLFQSTRLEAYQDAVLALHEMGLTYPCRCTRKDISAALSAPQEGDAPMIGPDGVIYPGTCRGRDDGTDTDAIRLDMRKATALIDWSDPPMFEDVGENAKRHKLDANFLIQHCGDFVLARKDIGTSYHVAVVVDDAMQDVSHVTRGVDMAPATAIHVLLQRLLGFQTPIYRHHRLIRDADGKRLAKRHDALALRKLRSQGWTPEDILLAVMQSV
ncbi:MAG: tRNA glutamyl-Q(34) synthetase GluQRS [Amylibacter sp.]